VVLRPESPRPVSGKTPSLPVSGQPLLPYRAVLQNAAEKAGDKED